MARLLNSHLRLQGHPSDSRLVPVKRRDAALVATAGVACAAARATTASETEVAVVVLSVGHRVGEPIVALPLRRPFAGRPLRSRGGRIEALGHGPPGVPVLALLLLAGRHGGALEGGSLGEVPLRGGEGGGHDVVAAPLVRWLRHVLLLLLEAALTGRLELRAAQAGALGGGFFVAKAQESVAAVAAAAAGQILLPGDALLLHLVQDGRGGGGEGVANAGLGGGALDRSGHAAELPSGLLKPLGSECLALVERRGIGHLFLSAEEAAVVVRVQVLLARAVKRARPLVAILTEALGPLPYVDLGVVAVVSPLVAAGVVGRGPRVGAVELGPQVGVHECLVGLIGSAVDEAVVALYRLLRDLPLRGRHLGTVATQMLDLGRTRALVDLEPTAHQLLGFEQTTPVLVALALGRGEIGIEALVDVCGYLVLIITAVFHVIVVESFAEKIVNLIICAEKGRLAAASIMPVNVGHLRTHDKPGLIMGRPLLSLVNGDHHVALRKVR
ncbi:hypothetical protein PG985_013900 [Apiospora marii]|uniref:uncharacterized protein n=1 Tax=Apiospora marii TaxID=335849 RepID=UPI00312D66BC